MTAPMTPDEARLRELAEARVRRWVFGQSTEKLTSSKRADLRMVLDALSAERERADRAVGLVGEFAQYGLNHTSRWVALKAQDFLATQKAEGA